jgi:hypothetical protein
MKDIDDPTFGSAGPRTDLYLRCRKEAEMKKSSKIVVRSLFALIALISLAGCYESVLGPEIGGGAGFPHEVSPAQT